MQKDRQQNLDQEFHAHSMRQVQKAGQKKEARVSTTAPPNER
jgi:hypothetical protein